MTSDADSTRRAAPERHPEAPSLPARPSPAQPTRRWLDVAAAAGLGLAYVVLLLSTADDLGYARDEGFYFHAARSYEQWFQLLFSDPARALERETIDRFWSVNREHPALMKSLFALSHHWFYEQLGWFREEGTAYRFPGMLMGGLAVAVTYLWGSRAVGRLAGIVAAVSFAMMPRVFYHSHLNCFDVPVASMWLVTSYAYWRSLSTKGLGWPIATGLLYGLLLNTKHNSWLLPFALVAHVLITRGPALVRELKRGSIRVPLALVAMATLGPLLFYATWPWIWHDTVARFMEYAQFHLGHEYYNMEFLGQTYFRPPMPLTYAPVMTLATVPLVTLALAAIGLAWSFRHAIGRRWNALPGWVPGTQNSMRRDSQIFTTDVLWVLCIFMSYAPWLNPNTPIFGGTKHWITAYPFLCLFAARGFELLRQNGLQFLETHPRFRKGAATSPSILSVTPARTLSGVLAASVIVAPTVMTLGSHPWGLSAYTPIVGGAPGAASLGLNRTFWGYTTGSLQDYLNQHAPANATVYVHDTALQSWEMMRRDSRLRPDLRGTLSIADSSVALYHHEPHMGRVEYQIWVTYGTQRPATLGTHHGVPVVWIYARPRH